MRLLLFVFTFLMPGGFIVLLAFLSTYFKLLDPWLYKIETAVPFGILAVGVILGWRFHRSRLAYVIFILFLSERSLYYFGDGGSFAFGQEKNILLANGVLLPINIALFYLVKERGILNLGGITRIIFILVQPLTVYLLLLFQPMLFTYLEYQFLNLSNIGNIPLPQPVMLIYSIMLMVFFTGSLFGRGPIIRGFFWALIASLLAFSAKSNNESATLYYSGAGLIVIIAVIETAYAMAFQDELTGLPARRALNTALSGVGRYYSIAMLDIDFFKKFNDRYGHDVGDQVLCMVASHLKRVGGGGKPYRYGGEEFTILFAGKSMAESIPFLERLRQSIEAAQFVLRGKNRPQKPPKKFNKAKTHPKTVSVTISIGVAEPESNRAKPASVMKAADNALYRAKKRGRNCIAT